MEISELIEISACRKDNKDLFISNLHSEHSLCAEVIAFCNSGGGRIFIGIENESRRIVGLSKEDINRINVLIPKVATESINPQICLLSENILLLDGLVMVLTIPDGISKPYMDNKGAIWVKNGSDKRKVTSREEMQRMFQSAGLLHGDEIPANGLTIADIDQPFFKAFFQKEYGESLDEQDNPLQVILENMNLVQESNLNIAGALLFAKQPSFRLPTFIVKAVAYPGTDIDEDTYIDSRDMVGKISDIFQQVISFLIINTRHAQANQTVNTTSEPVIPKIVFEELVANALIHRDYFISAPVRIFIFSDRIEIISPGHLPNNLTVQNIKSGNSNIRNPILASFATKLLPYRGLGNGVRRALKAYAAIEFNDDRENNLFKVTIRV
jgi:ATP-dependent DNA helicase RecG